MQKWVGKRENFTKSGRDFVKTSQKVGEIL